MAFSNYHEKFRQIGTNPDSYESWVDSEALLRGLERLRNLMKLVSPSSDHVTEDGNANDNNEDKNVSNETLEGTCSFERELSFDFAKHDCIKEEHNGRTIVGVAGVCDWINENRTRSVKTEDENRMENVDLIEIKFVHHLRNVHRLQVLIYTALYALHVNNVKLCKCDDDGNQPGIQLLLNFSPNDSIAVSEDEDNSQSIDIEDTKSCAEDDRIKWEIESCRGMLFNARTGETEFCTMEARNAMNFLLDISQFKYNGKDRRDVKKAQKVVIAKNEIKVETATSPSKPRLISPHHRRLRKKRLKRDTGQSYCTQLNFDSGDGEGKISIPATTCVSKRPKTSPNTTDEKGIGDDPILLD